MAWADSVTKGLQEKLDSSAEIVFVHLDVKRFPSHERIPEMEMGLDACVARCHPRAIVAIDDFAYDLVLARRPRWSGVIPIVFGGVNYLSSEVPPRVTGVVEANNFEDTFRLAFALQPKLRRIMVVSDASETGRSNMSAITETIAQMDMGGRSVSFIGEGTFSETEAVLSTLDPAQDAVLLLSWNVDREGRVRSYDEAAEVAHARSPAPIYSVWAFMMGQGVIGGALLDGEIHGQEIGDLVNRILHGEDVSAVPIVRKCRTAIRLDYRELDRFSISMDRVPAGAKVLYQPHSILHEYIGLISGVVLILALQGCTIGGLFVSRRKLKQAEHRLHASKEQLRLTLDSSSDAIIAADVNACVVLVNPVAAQLIGLSGSECVGRNIDQLVGLRESETDAPLAPTLSALVLRDRFVCSARSARMSAKAGQSHLIVSYSASPICDDGGVVSGMVLAIRDITLSRQLEEQLRQSQKIESIGLLAGGIAHDFNNILQVIDGNLALLEEEGQLSGEPRQWLTELRAAAGRAGSLTRQLLAFGRRQKLSPADVDLAILVDGVAKMVRRLIGVSIKLEVTVPVGKHWVHVDAGQIDQVLMNLCINARDAMPRGGVIRIVLNHREFSHDDARSQVGVPEGVFEEIIVSDNGMGMDAATLARIFEPFYTTKAAGKGTGLGLSVVQGIVQQHKGAMHVASQLGVGSSFHVYLPSVSGPSADRVNDASSKAEVISPNAAPVTHAAVVLLVDDDVGVRRAIARVLAQSGFEVLQASDGEEACLLVETRSDPLDAVVLDVIMPRLGGIDAAHRISEFRPEVPIVLCSGFPGVLPENFELLGKWRWLMKPYPARELTTVLEELGVRGRKVGTQPRENH